MDSYGARQEQIRKHLETASTSELIETMIQNKDSCGPDCRLLYNWSKQFLDERFKQIDEAHRALILHDRGEYEKDKQK